jgi:hypothetical protein
LDSVKPNTLDYKVSILFGVKDLDPLNGDLVDLGKLIGTGSVNGKLKSGVVLEGKTQGVSFGKTKAIDAPDKFNEEIKKVADANKQVTTLEGLLSFEWDPTVQKAGDSITFSKVGVEVAVKGNERPIPEPAFVQFPLILTAGALVARYRRRGRTVAPS